MRELPDSNERGSALVITLWASLLLCVIAVELAYSTRLELRTLGYGARREQAAALARSAARAGIARIAENAQTFTPAPVLLADDGSWRAPSGAQPAEIPENTITNATGDKAGAFTAQIIDESGKLDANTADAATLSALLKSIGMQNHSQLSKSIVEYRGTRPGGSFLSVDEIANAPGLDVEMIFGEDINNNGLLDENENDGDKTAPDDNSNGRLDTGAAAYLTASPPRKISLNLAQSPVVQAVLGVTKEQAAELVSLRSSLGAFSSLEQLRALPWMSGDLMKSSADNFSLSSTLFTVRASASAEGGPHRSVTASVLSSADGAQAFLWREKQL